ncbi:HAD-IA family hydrolase [Neisseria wadsworthii]|uniref:IA family HAD hydrolase n=1 Tax=Neisseria wadsworthii 9715 TaxID=1030841 RepID=G4CTE5_9NEIS|nr:HAD-IA family hydrolase [Neisseria wadsworthii]EGZ44190.1 IA family HAD hydrolase [Neisseria wadsworthii 9715]QMT35933.1 HAD-IA family hydrolase [Neisseria wadsworthii]
MPPKLIIFDWDGTLADTTFPIIRTMQHAFAECDLDAPSEKDIRSLIGKSLPGIIHALAPNLPASRQEHIARVYTRSQLNPNNQNMRLFDDAIACLNTLKAQGYWLAVATGKGRSGLNKAIAQTGTADYWLATRCASECPPKPAPDMLLEICDELGVQPEEALLVGDTLYDLEMAANAKIRAIGITTGAHTLSQIQSAPHLAILPCLSELPDFLNTL